MPFLQPNVTYTGNAQALFVPMGSGNVVPSEITFADGINVDAPGIVVNNSTIAVDGVSSIITAGVNSSRVGILVRGDAETEVLERSGVEFTNFIDQEGVPAYRISIGGGGATGVDKENVLGLYVSNQAEPPVETAVFEVGATGAMDIKVPLTIDGQPVPRVRKVPYVGLTGTPATTIQIAAGSTNVVICEQFSVKAGHTYRASVQGFWNSADPAPTLTGMYVITTGDSSITQVGMGGCVNNATGVKFGETTTATFVPLTDSDTCQIVAINSSASFITSFIINATVPGNAPAVVVEDLGVLPSA